jgi:hypothetical protein
MLPYAGSGKMRVEPAGGHFGADRPAPAPVFINLLEMLNIKKLIKILKFLLNFRNVSK